MVIPWARAATPSRGFLYAPNRLILKGWASLYLPAAVVPDSILLLGTLAHPLAALSTLAVELLQRRADVLPQAGTDWLNTTYKVAGLIVADV